MRHWTKVASRVEGPFEIVHSWTYEDCHPSTCFDDTEFDIDEMCRKIDAGYLDWFVARVQVFYNDIEVGSDYLGANLYDSVDTAFAEGLSGYLEDMEAEALAQAGDRMSELKEKILADFG